MKVLLAGLILILLFVAAGCPSKPTKQEELAVILQPPGNGLSWGTGGQKDEWTKFLVETIDFGYFSHFDKAQDATRFCSNYLALTHEQKVKMWAEVIVWMSFYESSWDPTSRMVESQTSFPTPDPVTHEPVASEGLMQMSYQDTVNYKEWLGAGWCGFDWQKDKDLDVTDKRKTIFDPKINLLCAIKVMSNQIDRTGKVILSKNVYWAVLKDGGKYGKVDQITSRVKKAVGCL